MTPTTFPQANTNFGPPPDLDASQCGTIPAYVGNIQGGNLDGSRCVIVAWQPSAADLHRLNVGAPIFLMMIGGLAPHQVSTNINFE